MATHAFKLLKAKYLDNQASESESDYDMDSDDDSRDMVNNVVLNHEDDSEIKFFNSFCKSLPSCYPLTLNWTKLSCPCSNTMQPWSEEHQILSNRY